MGRSGRVSDWEYRFAVPKLGFNDNGDWAMLGGVTAHPG